MIKGKNGTVHLVVKGKVQGVFYRVSTKKEAERLKLTGWVKNTSTGDVEIMASGQEEALDEFILWCKQGPPRARVTEVVIVQREECTFSGFVIER